MGTISIKDTVETIMTRETITIGPNAPAKKALRLMIKWDIGSLIVVQNGEPIAIITERDVTRRSLMPLKTKDIYDRPVRNFMTHPLVTAAPTTPIWEAFEAMVTKKIRRLPIVEDGQLIGIVTERDLLKWVLRVFYEPNIPDRIKKYLR